MRGAARHRGPRSPSMAARRGCRHGAGTHAASGACRTPCAVTPAAGMDRAPLPSVVTPLRHRPTPCRSPASASDPAPRRSPVAGSSSVPAPRRRSGWPAATCRSRAPRRRSGRAGPAPFPRGAAGGGGGACTAEGGMWQPPRSRSDITSPPRMDRAFMRLLRLRSRARSIERARLARRRLEPFPRHALGHAASAMPLQSSAGARHMPVEPQRSRSRASPATTREIDEKASTLDATLSS